MLSNTVLKDLPATIKAYTVLCPDGTYTIVLNSRLSHEQQLEAYKHELKHIMDNDFDIENGDADAIEQYAHNE